MAEKGKENVKETDKEFFDSGDNAVKYLKICEEMGEQEDVLREAVQKILRKHVKKGLSILELGMGGGGDLDKMTPYYKTCGSDGAKKFLELYRKKKGSKCKDLILLDAVSLKTDRKFDCIFSNKVLIHFNIDDMKRSLIRQKDILNSDGFLCHSFWLAEKTKKKIECDSLRFVYYAVDELKKIYEDLGLEILETFIYKEFAPDDSAFIVSKIANKK